MKMNNTDLWVCLLPSYCLEQLDTNHPTTLGDVCVVGDGDKVVILDDGDSHKIQAQYHTRGQFLTQFIPQHNTCITSLSSIASIIHHQVSGDLSSRLLFSSVKDIVMGKDILAILTDVGEMWKMDSRTGQLISKPLLTCVMRISLVGEILTAVTMDSCVYVFDMTKSGESFSEKVVGLSVRKKQDILDNIVEESNKLESITNNLSVMKLRLEQLRTFNQLLLIDFSDLFKMELTVASVDSFSTEKCIKVSVKNLSKYQLLGKYWSLKLDIYLARDMSTLCKTVPLPSSFSFQDTVSCLLPLTKFSDLPLSVRSQLVFRDEVLLPSLPLATMEVTVMDVLTMSWIGVGTRNVVSAKEKFFRSLENNNVCKEGGGVEQSINFLLSWKLADGKNSKVGEVLTASENIPAVWNCLDKTIKISTKFEEAVGEVQVTIVGDDKELLMDVRREIETKLK